MQGKSAAQRGGDTGTASPHPTSSRAPRNRTIALACGLVLTAVLTLGFAPTALAANPDPVQTYYVPFQEDQILGALQTVAGTMTPASPVTTYITITTVANGTLIYYDQWENGYDPDVANPINIYSAGNPGGTQIWGDGNTANGAPPGVPSDVINSGTVITLSNQVPTGDLGAIDFDGRDKFAATKTIAVTRTSWASGSSTLFAGCVEVFDTNNWGTDYRTPIGTNIPDTTGIPDNQMFEYTALAISAGEEGATVSLDRNNDGDYVDAGELNNEVLAQGETRFVSGDDNGVNPELPVGTHVVSTKPIQVDIFSGDIGSNYESRDSALLPTTSWASSYYTPVSTPNISGYGDEQTTVWLYNGGTGTINMNYQYRNAAGVLQTVALANLAAGAYAKQLVPVGTGARFYTTTANGTFYAYSVTDSNSTSANNQGWDWSFTMIPRTSLTTQLLVGLGLGRDPTSGTNPYENGNPLWITPVGNGETATPVYVDYDADPTTGLLTDPNGKRYDILYSLKELQQAKVYASATIFGTSSAKTADGTTASTLTYSHDSGTGSNRLLLVGVAIANDDQAGGQQTVSSVTYNGDALTSMGFVMAADPGGGTNARPRVEIWARVDPDAGANNVVVTLSGNRSFSAGATTFYGVDVSGGLTSALGTFASNSATSGTTATVDVTGSGGQMIYDVVAAGTIGATDPGAFTPSPGSQVWTQYSYSGGTARRLRAAGSTAIAVDTTTTVTETRGTSSAWAIAAVPIRPVKRNQTGILAYTLDGSVKLAGAWGQNPAAAVYGAPGLDVGTSVPPMPEFSPGKDSSLQADNDGDGYISPGDVLTYTITAYNIARLPVPDIIIRDTIPTGCTYVANSTYKTIYTGSPTLVPDNPTGGGATAFPLDSDGTYDGHNVGTIPVDQYVIVTFRAQINSYESLGGLPSILNGGSGAALGIRLPVKDTAKIRGRIGDVLWNDIDQDGIQDPGEGGVAGVTVRLLNASGNPVLDDAGVAITAVTGVNGTYDFKGLYGGTYIVEFELPDSWNAEYTTPNVGTDDEVDSDAVVTGDPDVARTAQFVLGSGQKDWSRDGGIHPPYPTLVVVSSFGASLSSGRVVVTWETASETGTAGFYVERLDAKSGNWVKVNQDIVPALLESPTGGSYSLVDGGATANKAHIYRLVEVETTGEQLTYGPYVVTAKKALAQGDASTAIARGAKTVREPKTALRGRPSAPAISARPFIKKAAAANRLRIELVTAGLYRIEVGDIVTGLGVSEQKARNLIAKSGLRLESQGKAVAYMKASDESAIYFYGEAIDSIYTSANVYWMTPGEGTTIVVPTTIPMETGALTTTTTTASTPVEAGAGTTTTTVAPVESGAATTTTAAVPAETGAETTTTTVAPVESGAATTTTAAVPVDTGAEITTTTVAPVAPEFATSFVEDLHFEQDVTNATGLFHNADDDFWFWTYMSAGDVSVGARTLEIDAPDALGGISLQVELCGVSSTGLNNEHHVQAWLNGSLLGDARWTGTGTYEASFTIPVGLLLAGKNQVKLVALKESGVAYSIVGVDSLGLTYERSTKAVGDRLLVKAPITGLVLVTGLSSPDPWVLDLTDPRWPQVVQSSASADASGAATVTFAAVEGRYYLVVTPAGALRPQTITGVAASALGTSRTGADYVVITAPSLSEAAARLAAYRSSQGMTTLVVTTTQIYDAFSHGVATPTAIKTFVAYMTSKWRPAPRYVVLAGEGSFDYKNLTGSGDCLVPPLLVDTANGLAASDVLLADNKGDDGVPEVAIGRIPALTSAELDAVLAKMKAYEADAQGAWRKTVVLAADNPDKGGDFTASSETIAALLPSSLQVTKAYMGTLELAGSRTSLLDSFSKGALFINYTGHGAVDRLAQEGLLTKADVAALPTAGSRLPVVAALTCVAGNYAIPGWDGLGEALVKRTGAGAIAVWSPAALEANADSVRLGEFFARNLFGSSKTVVLGVAVQSALKSAAAQHLPVSVLRTYNLLGDPALRVQK